MFVTNPEAAGPRGDIGATGLIDPVFSPGAGAMGNGQGGASLIDPVFSTGPQGAQAPLQLVGAWVGLNGRFGVLARGGGVAMRGAAVTTSYRNGTDDADGVVVLGDGKADVAADIDADSLVAGHARSGIRAEGGGTWTLEGLVASNVGGGT